MKIELTEQHYAAIEARWPELVQTSIEWIATNHPEERIGTQDYVYLLEACVVGSVLQHMCLIHNGNEFHHQGSYTTWVEAMVAAFTCTCTNEASF